MVNQAKDSTGLDGAISPPRLFISYSRADGRASAEGFERRIKAEGLSSWRDLKDVEGGEDIRAQALTAIEAAEHLVLILTRRALASDWVRREWMHARKMGVKVSPVLADSSIGHDDLPGWARRSDIYDIAETERWAKLVQVLKGPGATRRTPWMAGPLPESYVPRPAEFERLKAAVLASPSGPVALTTALQGAGGYGKPTLANSLCRDEGVYFEFSDGIVRVEIGKERQSVLSLVVDLIEKLDPGGQRPGFQDEKVAGEHLGQVLGEARILLVIDDVWRESQLTPFLLGGPNCVRLVTTRKLGVLPATTRTVDVDEMQDKEALDLIAWRLPTDDPATDPRLAALARRLEYWAQMLEIANGWLRARVRDGEPLGEAIRRLDGRLTRKGPKAFDPRDPDARSRAVAACIEASIEDLDAAEQARLEELAILPEDEDIPLESVEALWGQAADLDEDDADEFVRRLRSLSLLQRLDLGARVLRLHDNMIRYLRDRMGPDRLAAAHGAMVAALGTRCGNDWAVLPAEDVYGWRFALHHLRGAGRDADALLTDYDWIRAKLAVRGAQELMEAWLPEPADPEARLVGRAVALSTPTLSRRPTELARQIFGRLGNRPESRIAALVAGARRDPAFAPSPRWPGLTPPGPERLRLVGHEDRVVSAAFSPDGSRIVTASFDGTARVWDAATGAVTLVLGGDAGTAESAAFSPDGSRIITAMRDGTVRAWDAATGSETLVLGSDEGTAKSAAFSPDGSRIVTVSGDRTVCVWDAVTGANLLALECNEERVESAAFSPDGAQIVTTVGGRTARVWDATTGAEVLVLRGHPSSVESAAFSPDGTQIVTAGWDGTACVWDAATGAEIHLLRGHKDPVLSVAFSPDSTRIVTASRDCTARVWDVATRAEIDALRGHADWVLSAAFLPDGTQIVTASWDETAKVWDAAASVEKLTMRSHESRVETAAFSPDGARIVTAAGDRTARVWDAATGAEILVLGGHERPVETAAFSPDGARIVTAARDRTARVWDAATGAEIHSLVSRGWVRSAAFSPDGSQIVTDGKARVWDATTGAEIHALGGHESSVKTAAFSPDGARIVTAADHTALVWDATTGAEILVLRGHEGPVETAAFSPDGARIVTASKDGMARAWDTHTGSETLVLRGHDHWMLSAVFSPDGVHIVTTSYGGTVRLWEAATGSEILVLGSYRCKVWSAAFSPDGAQLVTGSDDGTARVWDVATRVEIANVTLDAPVVALAIHDGAIAFGDALGRIHVFDLAAPVPDGSRHDP